MKISLIIIISILFSINLRAQKDNLPSFNEGKVKSSIIKFVEDVSNPNSPNFVSVKDRIAVFDNDGTLWVEQPIPTQLYFTLDRAKQLAQKNPNLASSQILKTLMDTKSPINKEQVAKEIVALVGEVNKIDNVQDFDPIVNAWIDTAIHPVMKRKIQDLVYQPMLELLDYLRTKEFTIYICSGGSQEFMRPWAYKFYKIDKDYVIGSTFKTQPIKVGDTIKISQTDKFEFLDDHMGKVVNIQKFIGKKPIFIAGNSDGDLEMMEYMTSNNPKPAFCLYVHHTDGVREFEYNAKTLAGNLIKGYDEAIKRGWTIIDMKKDWKRVFTH